MDPVRQMRRASPPAARATRERAPHPAGGRHTDATRRRPRWDQTSGRSALPRRRPGAEERVLVLGGEDVDAELSGDLVTDAGAAHAVAVDVQTGREDADAELARDDGEDAAADAALGRHADLVGPRSRGVVHPARVHDAQQVADALARERPLAGKRVDS